MEQVNWAVAPYIILGLWVLCAAVFYYTNRHDV